LTPTLPAAAPLPGWNGHGRGRNSWAQWSAYGSFPVFAEVLILIPGPDFAVVTKNALAGGRVVSLYRARCLLLRRGVRRSLDGATGLALLGFSTHLAAEQA
jgi:threonine/homoserine/homoserine lactone efflux protein